MKAVRALAAMAALLATSRTLGIQGCLTPAEDLARRADVVVVGTIKSVEAVSLDPCPEFVPEPGRFYPHTYQRCGQILGFTVSTTSELRGSAPPSFFVLVPLPSFGFLSLTCDDRPSTEAMVGLHAVLFLEKSGDTFWSVDGPDGIYCQSSPVSSAESGRVRGILTKSPRERQ